MSRGWWSISMQLSLNDEKVYFEDLSETSQEHISQMILKGYTSGELNEEDEDKCEKLENEEDFKKCFPEWDLGLESEEKDE